MADSEQKAGKISRTENRTAKCLSERERENFNDALFAFAFFSRRHKRLTTRSAFGRLDVPQAELNDSGGLWRVGKSLEAFALKVASQWQTAFFVMSAKSV
jgi:hypothetical protein